MRGKEGNRRRKRGGKRGQGNEYSNENQEKRAEIRKVRSQKSELGFIPGLILSQDQGRVRAGDKINTSHGKQCSMQLTSSDIVAVSS